MNLLRFKLDGLTLYEASMSPSNAIVLTMVSVFLITGCSTAPDLSVESWPKDFDVDNPQWSKLEGKRIYFGHQSVGMDVINGLQEISDISHSLNLNIIDLSHNVSLEEVKNLTLQNRETDGGYFAHGGVGENGKPISKLKDFEKQIDEGFEGKLDIALFKFCYKDFNDKTDVTNVFREYNKMVTRIRTKYPDLTIVHVTTPLRNPRPYGWKNRIKLFVDSKSFQEYEYNIARAEYNGLLNEAYEGISPIFDLALLESTRPDGSREVFKKNKKNYQRIYPNYTYDGGHLTPIGKRILASGLLPSLITP